MAEFMMRPIAGKANYARLSKKESCPVSHHDNIDYLLKPSRFGIEPSAPPIEQALTKYLNEYPDALLLGSGLYKLPSLQMNVFLADKDVVNANCRILDAAELSLKYPDGPKFVFVVWSGLGKMLDVTSVPLMALVNGSPDLRGTYTVYGHTFTSDSHFYGVRGDRNEPSYVGVTKQGWHGRFAQHVSDAASGSPYRFHEAIRRFSHSHAMFHEIISCGTDRDTAFQCEEWLVDTFSLYPKGFNMIPGGLAGIRYLSSLGFQVGNRAWENRHALLRDLSLRCSREGRPNPLISALWRDDDYASSVICKNPNNFDLETVGRIRLLGAFGKQVSEIATQFGCREQRVRDLLAGKTYCQVH